MSELSKNRTAGDRTRVVLDRTVRFIERQALMAPGQRIAVAVSGGADSVALLQILLQLRERLGITLAVAHFNHKLRAQESDDDARFVEELARGHSLAFHACEGDVAAACAAGRTNLEATARRLRYEFLQSLVVQKHVDRVVTAHTADDQAETVLARFVRGAGTRGMGGIYPLRDGWLARPLLEIRREELRVVLAEAGAAWREDSSNADLHFTRNRVRKELLPALEAYNPRIVSNLSAASQAAREEEDYWRARVPDLLARTCQAEKRGDETLLKLNLTCFVQLLSAEQRRLLRAAAERVSIRSLDVAHVEALLRLAVDGRSGQQLSVAGLRAVRVFGRLELRLAGGEVERKTAESAASYNFELPVPGACILPCGSQMVVELVDRAHPDWGYNIMEEGIVDPRLVSNLVTVRNWNPGDTFESPKGTRKLKQLLLGERIPAEERKGWPVVLTGAKVIWSRGFGVARAFRLRSDNSTGIWIHEVLAHA